MYIVRTYECTSRMFKNFITVFQKYSELYLGVQLPTLQAAFWEGWPGDCDLQLRHLSVDIRS